MAGNARTADFAATAPWSGITGKPTAFPSSPASMSGVGAADRGVLAWDSTSQQWRPITLLELKQRLEALA